MNLSYAARIAIVLILLILGLNYIDHQKMRIAYYSGWGDGNKFGSCWMAKFNNHPEECQLNQKD